MIQITFKNQPSNVGTIQQFEDATHLKQWLIDNKETLNGINIDVDALTIDPNYGKIETIA